MKKWLVILSIITLPTLAIAQMSISVIGGGQVTAEEEESSAPTVAFVGGGLEYIQDTGVYYVGGSLYVSQEN